jgi:hypothetical protein
MDADSAAGVGAGGTGGAGGAGGAVVAVAGVRACVSRAGDCPVPCPAPSSAPALDGEHTDNADGPGGERPATG